MKPGFGDKLGRNFQLGLSPSKCRRNLSRVDARPRFTSQKGSPQSRAALLFACAVIRAVASADTTCHNGRRDPVAMLAKTAPMRPRTEEIQNENAGRGSLDGTYMDNGIRRREVGLIRSVKTKKARDRRGLNGKFSREAHTECHT
jgi:hypothetical protein